MIGITGVTGKLGSYVANLVDQKGIASVPLARSPERAKIYESAEIRKIVYANTPEVVEALKGIDILLMVSARENPERVKEHQDFLDAAKLAGVEHIVYTSFYGADEKATFTLSRDHAQTEAYIKELGFTYTFLRDNFYLDFLIDMALENGEIRGPAGNGKVSAVARKDTSRVAAEILLNPKEWENQTLNLTGPENLSMEEIVALLSKETGDAIAYVDETVEEAYESRKKWPAQTGEYDAWVSTYTAIKVGEQAGVSTDVEKVLGHPASSLWIFLETENFLRKNMIEYKHVALRYTDKNILKDVNLRIENGEFMVLVGPSGSGKTTMIKMINRLLEPTDGNIYMDGKRIKDYDERELRLSTGYVLQAIALFPNLTVAENIALIPEMKGWSKEQIASKTEELLNKVGLPPADYAHRLPSELSGGEQQRIGIVRAIIGEPKILLMDEPFSALDAISRKQLQTLTKELHKEFGMTTIFVTHDTDEALKLGDRIAVLQEGEIVQVADSETILAQPANDFVADLFGGAHHV